MGAMSDSDSYLVNAFPSALRDDALRVVSVLPQTSPNTHSFCVEIGNDTVWIPYRIYHDPTLIDSASLTPTQNELLACLLTRHHDGLIREAYLSKILNSKQVWVPPFVVQLVGEYVIEIIRSIRDSVQYLDPGVYRAFLTRNPLFYRTTKARVISYWNCYHRAERSEDYAGFQVLEFLDRLIMSPRA